MGAEESRGRIITFYSFKGGVGRTMALANLAYLAAYHHKKVLVMDWDLEAPGLLYYFRGLSNPEVMETAKHSEGVLNVLWEWYGAVERMSSSEEMDALIESFARGNGFDGRVHGISEPRALSFSGELHYMGPGSQRVQIGDDEVSYSQALSSFPWQQLFKESAGGVLIELWRRWAKANYDLVLVDSRTGLADVAGLCTMQMPDEVALCLVLNRQNMDGTGKVATSILEGRGDQIALRAVPMRVARADTSEESDARARALTVLAKTGAFSVDQLTQDFAQLAVSSSESVPFYETLAPFSAQDPLLDPLTLNYCRLASSILGQEITPPVIPDDLRTQVRRRQGQDRRSATIDYVNKLADAEPARTISELTRLVDSAWGNLHDEEPLDHGYVAALAELATSLDESEFQEEIGEVRENLRQLLRRLFHDNPDTWRDAYVLLLDRLASVAGGSSNTDLSQLGLLDEIDAALSDSWEVGDVIRRLEYRSRAAWQAWGQWGIEDATRDQAVEIQALAYYAEHELEPTSEQAESLAVARADMDILMGEVAFKHARREESIACFERAADAVGGARDREWDHVSPEARRVAASACFSLALRFKDLMEPAIAAQYALAALDAQPGALTSAARFLQLCELFASPGVSEVQAHDFTSRHLSKLNDRSGRGSHVGTLGLRLSLVPEIVNQLILLSGKLKASQMEGIAEVAARVIELARMRLIRLKEKSEPITPAVMRLAQEMIARPMFEEMPRLGTMVALLIESARSFDETLLRKE